MDHFLHAGSESRRLFIKTRLPMSGLCVGRRRRRDVGGPGQPRVRAGTDIDRLCQRRRLRNIRRDNCSVKFSYISYALSFVIVKKYRISSVITPFGVLARYLLNYKCYAGSLFWLVWRYGIPKKQEGYTCYRSFIDGLCIVGMRSQYVGRRG